MKGYGAVVYVRTYDKCSNYSVRLLGTKSRVAPLKTVTLPRLELCGALLVSKLICAVKRALNENITRQYLWSDSKVVVAWLNNSPHMWQTFVANRVAEIKDVTDIADWRHVKGEENPVDLVSRGLLPQELINNDLWFKGPTWLCSNFEVRLPQSSSTTVVHIDEMPEKRKHVAGVTAIEISTSLPIMTKMSSFHKLNRVIAYCLRWSDRHRKSKQQLPGETGPLKVHELRKAKLSIIRWVQKYAFPDELKTLERGEPISNKSPILSLNPFLSKDNLIRVGGRLRNARLQFDTRHPILMPSNLYI